MSPAKHRCAKCRRFYDPVTGARIRPKPPGQYDVIEGMCRGCYLGRSVRAALNCELIKARATVRAMAVVRGIALCLCLAALLCGCGRAPTLTEVSPVRVTWITNESTVATRGDTGLTNEATDQTIWISPNWDPYRTTIFCKFEPIVSKTNGGWNIAFKP